MPPKKVSTPAERVFRSSDVKEQVRFKPRIQKIKTRHSLGSAKSRQQTLTQIDFVSLQPTEDIDAEIEAWEEEQRPKKRRRHTDGNISTHRTQTLTQLEFASTPTSNFEDGSPKRAPKVEAQLMGPPMTPRKRVYEIPSSQSPVTPLSVRSPIGRSPLTARSMNQRIKSETSASPTPRKVPLLEIQDTFASDILDSQVSSAHRSLSTPTKGVRFSDQLEVISGTPVIKRPRQEIQDSEAETDEELETQDIMQGEDSYDSTQAVVQIVSSLEEEVELQSSPPRLPTKADHRHFTQTSHPMGERSDRSDILISIHPQHVANIISGKKNHEFRTWLIPSQVVRIWIYETTPAQSVKYMASIGSAKIPGEVKEDGIGNSNFNAADPKSNYAYEILRIYRLADPIPLATLKANQWMNSAPQKFTYVKPAFLDHLMMNLEQPLDDEPGQEPNSTLTESQEAEAQLHSTISQYTQHVLGSSQVDSQNVVRPSQATTVDLTQPQSQISAAHASSGVRFEAGVEDMIIPDSPPPSSQPLSFPVMPNKTRGITALSYPSSQLLTRSQMLPDSLMNDSFPPPPFFVDDSDEDSS
jgi:predicted transcriptional regulator